MIHHKKLFTADECLEIIRLAETNNDKDDVVWDIVAKKYNGWHFNYSNPNNRWVYHRLFNWMNSITGEEILYNKLITNSMESPMFVHRYSKEDFFIRHKDKVPNNTFYRIYNFGIQLSDENEYEG